MVCVRADIEAATRAVYRARPLQVELQAAWAAWRDALLARFFPAFGVERIGGDVFSGAVDMQIEHLSQRFEASAFGSEVFIWAWEAWQHAGEETWGRAAASGQDVAKVTQLFTDKTLAEDLIAPMLATLQECPIGKLQKIRILDPCSGTSAVLLTAFRALVPLFCTRLGWSVAQSVQHLLAHTLRGVEIDAACARVGALVLALEAQHGLRDNAAGWRACAALPSPIACTQTSRPTTTQDRARTHLGSLYDDTRHDSKALRVMLDKIAPEIETPDPVKTSAPVILGEVLSAGDAARILKEPTHHICTNVPFLARGKQPAFLRAFCAEFYPDARYDLANVFLERCLEIVAPADGQVHVLMPQNWLFLRSYLKQRRRLLATHTWHALHFCQEGAFRSAAAAGAFVILLHLGTAAPSPEHRIALRRDSGAGFGATTSSTPSVMYQTRLQRAFLMQTGARVTWDAPETATDLPLLKDYADAYVGLQTGDDPRYIQPFWAFESADPAIWQRLQNAPTDFQPCDGTSWLVRWEDARGALHAAYGARPDQGHQAVGKQGIAVQRMRSIFAYDYAGTRFHQNIAVIVPKDPIHFDAIRAFCHAPAFESAVRRLDQKLNVTNRTLVEVSFDLAHWQKVADKQAAASAPPRDPSGKNACRQWGFQGFGAPEHAEHIHLCRYLGMRWPTENTSSDAAVSAHAPWYLLLHDAPYAHKENIVASWLDALAHDALGDHALRAAFEQKDADARRAWLRDQFFKEHCTLFLQLPFVWQIWDGEPDGFSMLVRYHRLTHTGLREVISEVTAWMAYLSADIADAATRKDIDRRRTAAHKLHARLTQILNGTPPYDLHIRWKSPAEQPKAWTLDLNDGIRVHLRPFLMEPSLSRKGHGVLRHRPSVHFRKDRGYEPADNPWAAQNLADGLHAGARVNDRHRSDLV